MQPLIRELETINDAARVPRNRVNIISVPGVLNLFSMQTDSRSQGNITATFKGWKSQKNVYIYICWSTGYAVTRGVLLFTRSCLNKIAHNFHLFTFFFVSVLLPIIYSFCSSLTSIFFLRHVVGFLQFFFKGLLSLYETSFTVSMFNILITERIRDYYFLLLLLHNSKVVG